MYSYSSTYQPEVNETWIVSLFIPCGKAIKIIREEKKQKDVDPQNLDNNMNGNGGRRSADNNVWNTVILPLNLKVKI